MMFSARQVGGGDGMSGVVNAIAISGTTYTRAGNSASPDMHERVNGIANQRRDVVHAGAGMNSGINAIAISGATCMPAAALRPRRPARRV